MNKTKLWLKTFVFIFTIIVLYLIFIVAYPFVYATQINPTFGFNDSGEILNSPREIANKIRVGVVGDSTAVGQGADTFEDNFSLQYLQNWEDKRSIIYQNFAGGGSKIENVLVEQFPKLQEFRPELVFVSIGANDVTATTTQISYNSKISELAEKLQTLNAQVIWLNIPDFITVPILLSPLKNLLSYRAKSFNQILLEITRKYEFITLIDVYNGTRDVFRNQPEIMFSADKYHPSSSGYGEWAKLIEQTVK